MKVPRKLVRAGSLAVTSVLVATGLMVVTAPVSADEVGIQSVREVGGEAVGGFNAPYVSPSGTPLLDHFFFRDVSDDQHLLAVRALPNGFGAIGVSFFDEDPEERYEYRVAIQQVSPTGLFPGTFTLTCNVGRCAKDIRSTRPSGDYVFMLSGFLFSFRNGDHHIDEIGILEADGRVSVYYNDQNDDDPFNATVNYVWMPRSRLSTVSVVAGDSPRDGMVQRGIAAGDKVIRGFYVDNTLTGGDGDNHIKRFGFLTNSTTVDIYYGDKAPSTPWSYEFRYGVLA